ncbi:hypothetical protein MVEN_00066200 [Mycena venus]|uniref:Uncharacterized protein n=1 Tax=Mycena venus TaxID=2733690 RepID=A0A8H6Z7L9_9AGAR|nr:hypothetical protein MVEN_00066200 [Mycena venus]
MDHRVDFSNDEVIMEDAEPVLKAGNQQPQPKAGKRSGPRQSAVSAFVDPNQILNTILNTPVTLPAGQILGVSTTVSNALGDALRLRNQPRNSNPVNAFANANPEIPEQANFNQDTLAITAASFITRDRQKLIRIKVTIDGKTVLA